MRIQLLSLTSSLLLGVLPCARAQESLADRFPADAIFYLEADTNRLVDGELSLDLVKLLDEAQVQEFLKPLAGQMPVQLSTQGLRQMIDSVPWRRFVNGRVEIAVRGFHVEVDGQAFDLSPSQPLDARQVNRLAGLAGQFADGEDSEHSIEVAPDMVACVDGGEGFEAFIDEMANSMGGDVEIVKIAGRDARKITASMGGGDAPKGLTHVVRDGNRWWFGGSRATLERCLKGGAQDSLARSRAFQGFKKQVSSVDPAVLAYVNVALAARIFERLVPPIMKEELDLFGFSNIEAFGLASSFVEGGVRDSIALTYSAPPTGFVSLLDCTDGGFQFLKTAPLETGFYLGARIDAEAFVDKLTKVLEELFPGSARGIEKGIAAANRELGMDLREQLLPAIGDELGVYLTSPGAGSLIPDGMVMVKIGDREQFEKLLALALGQAESQGIQTTEIKSLPEGCKGWTIMIPESPIQPAIATTNDLCCVSANVLALKKSLREMKAGAGVARCAADNPNLQRVLKGLTGAPTADGLSLLAFVDLRKLVEFGYQFAPMAASQLQQSGVELDFSALPETEVIASHFSGVGIAGRSDLKGLSLSFFTPTGILTGGAFAAKFAVAHHASDAMAAIEAEEPTELAAEPPAPAPAKQGKTRSLAELFANIEKATGATIDFPATMADVQVAYTPRSGKLETILDELGDLAGFSFEIRDVDGEKLVIVSQG